MLLSCLMSTQDNRYGRHSGGDKNLGGRPRGARDRDLDRHLIARALLSDRLGSASAAEVIVALWMVPGIVRQTIEQVLRRMSPATLRYRLVNEGDRPAIENKAQLKRFARTLNSLRQAAKRARRGFLGRSGEAFRVGKGCDPPLRGLSLRFDPDGEDQVGLYRGWPPWTDDERWAGEPCVCNALPVAHRHCDVCDAVGPDRIEPSQPFGLEDTERLSRVQPVMAVNELTGAWKHIGYACQGEHRLLLAEQRREHASP